MKKATLSALLAPLLLISSQTIANGGCSFEASESQGLFATCEQSEVPAVIPTGILTKADLAIQPDFLANFEAYQSDAAIIAQLAAITTPTEIMVIMGTWCGDCHRETPRLAKVLSQANNPQIKVTYIGVDRQKQDAEGLAKQFNFERIPTYIVLQDGQEQGRIIERTQINTEHDLLEILKK
ncbi:MAG: thioredoxin family protein [Ferrimonas sp.]